MVETSRSPPNATDLVEAFTRAIRDPADEADPIALGTVALTLIFTHPLYGQDARRSFSTALHAFNPVVIAVFVNADGVGFSIGNDQGIGDAADLRHRLGRMDGQSETDV